MAAAHAAIAEDVHQQRVRTGAGIKFPPYPVSAGKRPFSLSMDFAQSSQPWRPFQYFCIAGTDEIAVAPAIRFRGIDNYRQCAVAEHVAKALLAGERLVARAQLAPQLVRESREPGRHASQSVSRRADGRQLDPRRR